jgi:hypothetical protein
MQKSHLEWPLVFGTQADSRFLEKLPYIGLKPHLLSRLPTAGGAGLDEHPVANFTGPAEPLNVLKPVVAAEAAYGLAFILDKLQGRMDFNRLPQLFQLAINRLLA